MRTTKEALEELSKITECQHCGSHDIKVERDLRGREGTTMGDIPIYVVEAKCGDCGLGIKMFQVRG